MLFRTSHLRNTEAGDTQHVTLTVQDELRLHGVQYPAAAAWVYVKAGSAQSGVLLSLEPQARSPVGRDRSPTVTRPSVTPLDPRAIPLLLHSLPRCQSVVHLSIKHM